MNLELNVVKFDNEDVIATSGEKLTVELEGTGNTAHYHLLSEDVALNVADAIVIGGEEYQVGSTCSHQVLTLRDKNNANTYIRTGVAAGTYVYVDADASFKLVD